MIIKPRQDGSADQSPKPKRVTSGLKLFAPIGVAYTRSSQKKTVCLNLYCIVLKDLENDRNEGIIHTEKFWVSERALWKIANWCISMRYDAEFDCEDRDEIEKIIAHGQAFLGNIKVTDDGQYTRREIDAFSVAKDFLDEDGVLKLDKSMEEIVIQGETAFPKLIDSAKGYGVVFIDPIAERDGENAIKDTFQEADKDYDDIPF